MKVADIMRRSVISVRPDAAIEDAVKLMLQRRISGLPVIDASGKLVGIVTEGDFLRRAETGTVRRRPRWLEFLLGPGRLAEDYVRAHARKVEEVMTRDVQTVTEDEPVEAVVRQMERKRIKRLPVTRNGQVVGIVTRANLLRGLTGLAREAKAPAVNDRELRERLLAELEKQPWAPLAMIDITVRDGIVELWGTIMDERERQALVVAAENIPGVKDVRDHLTWVEPTSVWTVYQQGKNDERKDS